MGKTLLWSMVLGWIAGSWITGSCLAQKRDIADMRADILDAKTPLDTGKAYIRLFSFAEEDDVKGLLSDDSASIAINAVWELRDVYLKDYADPIAGVQRILGFIEGRIGVRLPRWWGLGLTMCYLEESGEHRERIYSVYLEAAHDDVPRPLAAWKRHKVKKVASSAESVGVFWLR